jgi:hypothetical protein
VQQAAALVCAVVALAFQEMLRHILKRLLQFFVAAIFVLVHQCLVTLTAYVFQDAATRHI